MWRAVNTFKRLNFYYCRAFPSYFSFFLVQWCNVIYFIFLIYFYNIMDREIFSFKSTVVLTMLRKGEQENECSAPHILTIFENDTDGRGLLIPNVACLVVKGAVSILVQAVMRLTCVSEQQEYRDLSRKHPLPIVAIIALIDYQQEKYYRQYDTI